MPQKKETKIKNTLKRFEENVNRKDGVSLMNDFLQLSKMLERLQETDPQSFNTMFCLIEEKLRLEEGLKERGKRIANLQRK